MTYNASNKVTSIVSDPTPAQGNDTGTVQLLYGADANRVVQSSTSGSTTIRTVYVGLGGTGKSLFEQTTTQASGGTPMVQNLHYIYAGGVHGGNAFAVRVIDDHSGVANKYYNFDHLGSVTAVSDEEGHVSTSSSDATVLAYDAWGARRNADESAAQWQSFTPPVGNREFTGQEQIPDTGLVNMNGRVYDPVLGRFLSPDPNVQDPSDTQSYNRYSYALNNPLRYTDPTGFFWNEVESTLESPMFWTEFGYEAIACVAGPPGVGCLVGGIQLAVFNATVALASGAPYQQTAIDLGIGVGVSIVGAEFPPSDPLLGLAEGSASAAATTAIDNRLSTGKWGGDDILAAAFMSAAEGALMLGIQEIKVLSVNQARAEGQAAGQEANTASAQTSRRMHGGSGGGVLSVALQVALLAMCPNCLPFDARMVSPDGDPSHATLSPTAALAILALNLGPLAVFALPELAVGAGGGGALALQNGWLGEFEDGVVQAPMTLSRVWGGGSGMIGQWFTPQVFTSAQAAVNALALPLQNTAEFITTVTLQPGATYQIGTAAPLFGYAGGAIQIFLTSPQAFVSYGQTLRLTSAFGWW